MAVAPSFQDELDIGEAELKSRRPDLLVAEGDITLAQLHAAAAMHDMVTRFAAQGVRATFLDGATEDELTTRVDDHYNIQREAAVAAQVVLQFTRSGSTAGVIPAGTAAGTEYAEDGSSIIYTTNVDLPFGTSETTKTVAATAVEGGRDGNVAVNTITRLIDVPSFDTTFTVTNPAAAGGGNDEESDEELRERARSFWATLRRGTLDALEYGAKQVPTVRVATASEDASGNVTVTVTDSDGNSTDEMVSDVEIELESWRCAGIPVTVVGGSQYLVDMTVVIAAYSEGFNVAAAAPFIEDAIEARINRLQAEETLYLDTIIATIIATAPDNIFDVTISSPASDVVPSAGQVIRAGTINVS